MAARKGGSTGLDVTRASTLDIVSTILEVGGLDGSPGAPGTLAKDCDFLGITSKGGDIGLHPVQRELLIDPPKSFSTTSRRVGHTLPGILAGEWQLIRAREPKNIGSIVDGHNDHALIHDETRAIIIWERICPKCQSTLQLSAELISHDCDIHRKSRPSRASVHHLDLPVQRYSGLSNPHSPLLAVVVYRTTRW